MVKVFFTVDVEVWCHGWDRLDEKFPDYFKRYVYGPTPHGDGALPLKLSILRDYGLQGVFLTEPLFSARFGSAPLQEIVGLIQEQGQEVQLHLHTEWVSRGGRKILENDGTHRQYLRDYTLEEQVSLLRTGCEMLRAAGCTNTINAFRAGSFGIGRDTLEAVAQAGLRYDLSYNQAMITPDHHPLNDAFLSQPVRVGNVVEYPMSLLRYGSGLRHLQLGACSFEEVRSLLWTAHDQGWDSVVMLSHNFELLNPQKTRIDKVVLRRYRQLCQFLDRHRDVFQTTGFAELDTSSVSGNQLPPASPGRWPWLVRQLEQAARRMATLR